MWITVESGEDFVSTWEMEQAAASRREYELMESERPAYFKAIYDDIRYYAYRYTDYSDEAGGSPSVETQVIEIVDRQNAYDLRIGRLKERYRRWTDFLSRLDPPSANLLRRRFDLNEEVSNKELRHVCEKTLKTWIKVSDEREKENEKEVRGHVVEMRRRYPELFEAKVGKSVRIQEKREYRIGDQFIEMLPTEYTAYREAELERIKRSTKPASVR